jgi:hypothetical protein
MTCFPDTRRRRSSRLPRSWPGIISWRRRTSEPSAAFLLRAEPPGFCPRWACAVGHRIFAVLLDNRPATEMITMRRGLLSGLLAASPAPSSDSQGRHLTYDLTKERGPANARVPNTDNLASGCNAGVPMSGNARDAACCLSGTGAFPRRRGKDTRRLAAASSRQGHIWAARGLPTPCRRGHGLHVSQSRRVRAGWRFRQREVTFFRLVHSGTCHRSMAQVRALARWFLEEEPRTPIQRQRQSGLPMFERAL